MKKENEELVTTIFFLESQNKSLKAINDSLSKENLSQKHGEEIFDFFNLKKEDARTYINDYYNFYARDKTFRNVNIRKIKPNVFLVALDEKLKGEYHLWYTQNYYLTVNSDKSYYFNIGPYINNRELGRYYLNKD